MISRLVKMAALTLTSFGGFTTVANAMEMKATEMVYWQDTEQFELDESRVVMIGIQALKKGGEEKPYIALDRTIFYPKGGGQPADTGTLTIEGQEFPVTFVLYDDGVIKHFVDADPSNIELGAQARQKIDGQHRLTHAKFHSAGHILERILVKKYKVTASKGNHDPADAWVEFVHETPQNPWNGENTEEVTAYIEQTLKGIIAQNVETKWEMVAHENLPKVLGVEELPRYIDPSKPTRVVDVAGLGFVPCGGTHVTSGERLFGFGIKKFGKVKKGRQKIVYSFR